MALELRPNCEYCDRDLPPASTIARICTYECTVCADCVEEKLDASINALSAAMRIRRERSGRSATGAGSIAGRPVSPTGPMSASGFGHSAQEQQAFDVVDEVGHTDLRRGSGDADGADEQVHPVFLGGEDMLDA